MVRHSNPRRQRLWRKEATQIPRNSSSEDEFQTFSSRNSPLAYNALNGASKSAHPTVDVQLVEKQQSPEIGEGIVLSSEQMLFLKNHDYEYNAAAGSILERFAMQRFWCWSTQFVPISVMPCTITAIGFALNLITSSILIYYSPQAVDPVPSWALALAALGVFLYQTADALDGKQCYKIQNSQIEEFYDHACDSVSTILLMYSVAIATQCGQYPTLLMALVYVSLVAFWCTHWQCYVTRQMIFGEIDVTEAQFVMIGTHLVSAMFGQQIWCWELFGSGVRLNQALALATLATLFRSIVLNCHFIWGGRTPLEIVGALPFKRRQDTLRPLTPIVLLTFLLVANWCVLPNSLQHHQFDQQQQQTDLSLTPTQTSIVTLVCFVLTFGTATAKLTMRLVLSHCTHTTAPLTDIALLPPAFLLAATLSSTSNAQPFPSYTLCLILTLLANCAILTHFFIGVGLDMERSMDVKIFSLKYQPGHPKNRTSHRGVYMNGLNNKQVLKDRQSSRIPCAS